jgi:hypothetical protein
MAIEQRADRAVRNDRDRAGGGIRGDLLDRTYDASLSIDCALPTAYRLCRLGEELIGDSFEFLGRQEAGCRAIVLAELRNLVESERKMLGQNGRAIDRLLLGAAIDRANAGYPGLSQAQAHALPAELGKRPARHWDIAAHNHVRVGDEVEPLASRIRALAPNLVTRLRRETLRRWPRADRCG